MKSQDENQPGKAYKSPEMVAYGNIREITQNVGMAKVAGDGGLGMETKTA